MKKYIYFFCLFLYSSYMQAQEKNSAIKDLAVPNSPAFIILDAAPTNIETPNNTKSFAFGMVQNFDRDSKWFDNYSMEFTPYWWFRPSGRNAYSFAGLSKKKGSNIYSNNILSGLQFTNISIALLNKDMIPDNLDNKQKILSIGARTTAIKIRSSTYSENMNVFFTEWEKAAQDYLAQMMQQAITIKDSAERDKFLQQATETSKSLSYTLAEKISKLVNAKPLFSWDIAGGFASYGVNDSTWRAGRGGAWTTLSSFIPFHNSPAYENYIDLLASVRYLHDSYVKNDNNTIVSSNSLDMGFKAGIEIEKFSLAFETMYRKTSGVKEMQQRITGVISFKATDNLYFNGTFGQGFGSNKPVLILFGVNCGFGSEKVSLP